MNRDQMNEVIGGRSRGSQIKDSKVRVGRDGGDDGGGVWGKRCRVRARVSRKGQEGGGTLGVVLDSISYVPSGNAKESTHNLDGAIPGA
jgi:hypothetical protein